MNDQFEQLPPDHTPVLDTELRLPEPSGITESSDFNAPPGPLSDPSQLPYSYQSDTPPLFQRFMNLPEARIPHLGHVALLGLLAVSGLAIAAILAQVAIWRHVFGVATLTEAASNVRYLLGMQAVLYLLTFAGSLIVFPLVWHKGFFDGVHWRGTRALQNTGYLMGAAGLCFVLAMIDGYFFPGPKDAPIDRIFRMPGAAWILFAFGITFAPFFEELAFRGFLLPALSTACDWVGERTMHKPRRPLDFNGHPQWSLPAMAIASLLTSVLFAFMHADQTSYSIGPLVLLVIVSLVLCFARLRLRSLAASVLLHASYNLLLFSFMLIGTSGFRHLDKM
jgi:membrane protease YdiL (CAAX protease family)